MANIVEIRGTDRVIIIHPNELSFTPALTLTDAEYQAAAERVVFAAEAMGEHVLIKGRAKPECMNILMCGDGCGTCIYYEAAK